MLSKLVLRIKTFFCNVRVKGEFMKSIRTIFIVVVVAMLAACSGASKKTQPSQGNLPILDVLPKHIQGFSYVGTKTYPEPWGYSLRYQLDGSQYTHADLYIYPVPKELAGQKHKDVIGRMKDQAIEEIGYAKEKGMYSEYRVMKNSSFNINGKFVSRTDIHLIKGNLVAYSLLFLTESDGKLIKVRMTMPDSEEVRRSDTWQKFVDKAFATVIKNIEKT